MSDTAAFFAKKKKKKAFKFNANVVDADSVTQTHIDAPAPSNEADGNALASAVASVDISGSVAAASSAALSTADATGNEWDEEAMAAASAVRKTGGPEVMDMKSMEKADDNNIAEKLRVEETRAQLAAAREGMEREAQKIKEAKETKGTSKPVVAARFAAAGAKWTPSTMRGPGRRFGGGSQKLDTDNEELFPDLAAAGKILEKQEKTQSVAYKVPKKTPVGGGANWASKKPEKVERAESPTEAEPPKVESPPAPSPSPPVPTPAPTKPVVRKTVKKKKKDLSTFKPGGS